MYLLKRHRHYTSRQGSHVSFHLMANVRKIMHRISAGPHLVVQRPSVASRRRLLETIFSVSTNNLLMQGLGGQAMCSQLLVCVEESLVAVVMEPLPSFCEVWISCVAMTASSQELSTELLQPAGMRG